MLSEERRVRTAHISLSRSEWIVTDSLLSQTTNGAIADTKVAFTASAKKVQDAFNASASAATSRLDTLEAGIIAEAEKVLALTNSVSGANGELQQLRDTAQTDLKKALEADRVLIDRPRESAAKAELSHSTPQNHASRSGAMDILGHETLLAINGLKRYVQDVTTRRRKCLRLLTLLLLLTVPCRPSWNTSRLVANSRGLNSHGVVYARRNGS